MKRLLYLPLYFLVLLSCSKDSQEVQSAAEFLNAGSGSFAGSWKLTEKEKVTIDDQKIWEPVSASQQYTMILRYDGVILNADGKPACCPPTSLIINDHLLDIKPQSPIPTNEACELVNCINCLTWEIEFTGNQMIVTACNSPRMKFVR
ncbi:hypothetical protein [Dyadobacter flavalbus]|uniref:hypothetical protein n=1 Tax=Dyadobacter flavalbus TaxID=2579942 RepID=UPI001E5580B2|nr:hypothetical protein [Dyadobacter flavalbus]